MEPLEVAVLDSEHSEPGPLVGLGELVIEEHDPTGPG